MSTQTPAPPQPTGRRKRGREGVRDMVLSLGLVLLIIIPVWWLAQPDRADKKSIRVVDISASLTQVQRTAPGLPVPRGLPDTWRSTVSAGDDDTLRIGWVTPSEQYAEWAVSLSSATGFFADEVGKDATRIGTFTVSGVTWEQWQDHDEHTTLVQVVGGRTLFVGGVRETTTIAELRTLAAAVQP